MYSIAISQPGWYGLKPIAKYSVAAPVKIILC